MITELERNNFFMLNWLDEFLVGHKGFVCGGCFKNIFNNERVKDIDIFFRNSEDWNRAVFYFDERSVGYDDYDCGPLSEEDAEYKFYYENRKVKAYKHLKSGKVIELCKSVFGTPKEVISRFDFTITKFAYYKEEVTDENGEKNIKDKIVCDEHFFEHLHLKRLVIDDEIPFPMSTFERVLRYAKYGYFPCKETKVKLAKAIKELDDVAIEVSDSLYNGMD